MGTPTGGFSSQRLNISRHCGRSRLITPGCSGRVAVRDPSAHSLLMDGFLNMSVWINAVRPRCCLWLLSVRGRKSRGQDEGRRAEITQTRCQRHQQKARLDLHGLISGRCGPVDLCQERLPHSLCGCSLTANLHYISLTSTSTIHCIHFIQQGSSNALWTQLCQYLLPTLVLHERG